MQIACRCDIVPYMYIFAILAFTSTLLGGLLALKLRSRMNLILGFTAGVLLAVVAFDLLPEIIELTHELSYPIKSVMFALIAGFMTFHIVEKIFALHHTHEHHYEQHTHRAVGVMSSLGIMAHAFLDGLGIGLAFQISWETGLAVAIAVLAHNFSDGINTVSLMLAHKNTIKKSLWFLLGTAIAPVLGALSSYIYAPSESMLILFLGFFTGFLLYISAADILPEAHSQKSGWSTILATLSGIAFLYTCLELFGGHMH